MNAFDQAHEKSFRHRPILRDSRTARGDDGGGILDAERAQIGHDVESARGSGEERRRRDCGGGDAPRFNRGDPQRVGTRLNKRHIFRAEAELLDRRADRDLLDAPPEITFPPSGPGPASPPAARTPPSAMPPMRDTSFGPRPSFSIAARIATS